MGNCWRAPDEDFNLFDASSSRYRSLSHSSEPSNPDYNGSKFQLGFHQTADLSQIKQAQSRNLIDHLPLIQYDSRKIKQTECAICLIDFIEDELVRQLPCHVGHVFHPACIDGWLEKNLTCPHCSSNVDAAILLKFIRSLDDDE